VSLLDTACARVAVGLNSTPGSLEDIRRRIIQLDTAIKAIERDAEAGNPTDPEELKALKKERKEQQKAHDELKKTWEQEKALAKDVIKLRREIRATENGDGEADAAVKPEKDEKTAAGKSVKGASPEPAAAPKRPVAEIRKDLDAATKKLEEYIGKRNPLIPLQVDAEVVAQILSDWTGIPAGSMVKDTAEAMLTFESRIGQRIIGQDHVLTEIGKRLRIAAGKLQDPSLPLAVFLMVGPSGTGKTETALALADLIFGGERFMTTLNMTEYSSSMNVSRLIGSAPGLVGFGEGGVLTEAVRQRPYSVVLLDEMEKAHMDVNLLFMQVFDKGALTDSEGRVANFKNTVIMMTSNEASDMIMEMCADGEMPTMDEMRTAIQPILEQRFTPAFVGRTTVIPFYPLSQETLRKIVDLKMNKIRRRLQDLYRLDLELTPAVGDEIGNRCQQITIGARLINLIINESVLPEIARHILEIMGSEAKYEKLVIDAKDGEFTYEFK
jgi:type VI secretion system protein VasG